jgi:hypothetical protein
MGKRSSFERIPRDFYPTPQAAVPPLLPHLRGVRSFAESCCGDGALVLWKQTGCTVSMRATSRPGKLRSLLRVTARWWTRSLLIHLTHAPSCMRSSPIFNASLLIDLDWAATKQAAPYLVSCTNIVSVGRLCLFPETKTAGKQNFGWFPFERAARGRFLLSRLPICAIASEPPVPTMRRVLLAGPRGLQVLFGRLPATRLSETTSG